MKRRSTSRRRFGGSELPDWAAFVIIFVVALSILFLGATFDGCLDGSTVPLTEDSLVHDHVYQKVTEDAEGKHLCWLRDESDEAGRPMPMCTNDALPFRFTVAQFQDGKFEFRELPVKPIPLSVEEQIKILQPGEVLIIMKDGDGTHSAIKDREIVLDNRVDLGELVRPTAEKDTADPRASSIRE